MQPSDQQGELCRRGPAPFDTKAPSQNSFRGFSYRNGNTAFSSVSLHVGHLNAAQTNPSHISAYLEYSLVGRMLLQLHQTIENNQLHVVVALLDNQIDVALGSSLGSSKAHTPLKLRSSLLLGLI